MKTSILLLLFALTSCSKDNNNNTTQDQLPPITTIGANTAGCIINGKVLVPKNGASSFVGTPYGLEFYAGNNFWPNKDDYWQLKIANNEDTNNNFGIVLWIKNLSSGNENYILNQSNGELNDDGPLSNQIIANIKTNGVNKTYWSSINSGVIQITRSDLAIGTSIYSGTFSCKLYNKDNKTEIIEVKDGRFDINSLDLNK